MNPASSDIKIDSPAPEVAHQDAAKYFQWLWPALEIGGLDYSVDELGEELLSGDVLLIRIWKGGDFVALAAARLRPLLEGRQLYIMGLVGEDSDDWLEPLADTFDRLAVESECVSIALDGRPGWSKKLRRVGYSLHQVTMRKTVEGQGNGQSRIQ